MRLVAADVWGGGCGFAGLQVDMARRYADEISVDNERRPNWQCRQQESKRFAREMSLKDSRLQLKLDDGLCVAMFTTIHGQGDHVRALSLAAKHRHDAWLVVRRILIVVGGVPQDGVCWH